MILFTVLKKDKWSDYASKFTDMIEVEEKDESKDKWSSYVKNVIAVENSPLLKKAEKKITKNSAPKKQKTPRYSDDDDDTDTDSDSTTESDSDSDSDSGKKKVKKKKGKKKKKSKKEKSKKKKNQESDDNKTDSDDDTGDKKKSKKVHDEKTDSDSDNVSDDEYNEIDHKLALLDQLEKVEEEPTPPPKNDNLPTKPQTETTTSVVEPTNTVYQNGPVVDFHEQIRRISTNVSPDASKFTDNKPKDTTDNRSTKTSNNGPAIHEAIDDILSDSPKQDKRNSQETKSKQKQAKENNNDKVTQPKVTLEDELKSLEESILANHDELKVSETKNRKESTVDDLIEELNLA